MSPKISVIIPVYNTEKYLPHCIDSILAQTYTDFELLLIDDGSKDSSGVICDEYATKDSRVRVFHKENGGVSSARNWGLDNANGEWITFVDSDDYLNIEAIEQMLSNKGEDLVVCSYQEFGIDNRINKLDDTCYNRTSIIPKLGELMSNVAFMTPWGKLFKMDLIKSYNLRFAKDISFGEDTLFVYKYLLYTKSFMTQSNVVYRYRKTGSGLSSQVLEIEHALCIINSFNEIFTQISKSFGNGDFSQNYWSIINRVYRMSLSYIMHNANNILLRISLLRQIHKSHQIRLYIGHVRQYPIGLKRKIWIFLAKFDKSLYLLSIYSYFYCYD
ncbi:MAG: glycosyltransferase family 2 protein [Alistipes sp.]|nr:glycosyltransferase family 2 protein [Alistipes sp.]